MQNYGKKCTKTIFKKDKNVWQSVKAYGKTSRKLRVSGVTTVKKKKVTLQKKNPHTGEKTENQLKNIKKKTDHFSKRSFLGSFLGGSVGQHLHSPRGLHLHEDLQKPKRNRFARGGGNFGNLREA